MSKGAVRRLIIEGSEIEYELIRKRIRNIYFSVKGGGKVLVSAPASVPICYVEKALMNRWPNIRKALDSQSNIPPLWILSEQQKSVCVYGKVRQVQVVKSSNGISLDNESVTVFCKDENDLKSIKKVYTEKIKENFKNVVLKFCERTYATFCDRIEKLPTIKFREMTSRWGSCKKSDCVITIAYGLAIAPSECIEYVIAHEFAHLISPDHSPRFYAVLDSVMPDHRSRRKNLKKYKLLKSDS